MLWPPANGNECCFGHHCCRQASLISIKHRGWHNYINFYINVMNLWKLFNCGLWKNMYKATHPSSGVASSKPRRWRGERLHHWCLWGLLCFCVVSDWWLVTGQSDSLYIHFRSVTLWLASHHLLIICTPEPSSDSHWEFGSSSRSWKLFKKRCLNQRAKIVCRLVMLDLCQLIQELWAHVGWSHSLLDCPPPVVGCLCPRPPISTLNTLSAVYVCSFLLPSQAWNILSFLVVTCGFLSVFLFLGSPTPKTCCCLVDDPWGPKPGAGPNSGPFTSFRLSASGHYH